jgi:hypothetical protein
MPAKHAMVVTIDSEASLAFLPVSMGQQFSTSECLRSIHDLYTALLSSMRFCVPGIHTSLRFFQAAAETDLFLWICICAMLKQVQTRTITR